VNATLTAASARLRRYEVSERLFRRLALAAAAMLLVVVATGATVRLTASGLGCEHWPGCQPGDPFPKKGYHSYVEFSNRVVAFFTILATLACWVGSLLAPHVRGSTRLLAGIVLLGTIGQAPLGAITVYFHLNPWLVITHLLLSLAVLAGGIVVALQAFARPPTRAPRLVAWASAVPLVALATLLVSGTIVTGSGPHPGGVDVRRLGSFQPAIWLHVRATAVFGITFLALLVWAWRERGRIGWVLRGGLIVLALLLCQMAVGEIQYRAPELGVSDVALPWWLVLVHVTLAACVWGAAVALVVSLWRSRAGLSVQD
jgi:cytochrome c oxidase assembly protein subunit 15